MSDHRAIPALRRHRRAQIATLVLMATYMPAPAITAWLGSAQLAGILGIAWFAGIAGMVVGLSLFRCPTCGQSFHRKAGVRGSVFYYQCMHCGMSLRTFD